MSAYVRSILSADGVAELIREHYGLEPMSVTLVRSLVNDVFQVENDERRFSFKVYRTSGAPRAHSVESVTWEQDLTAHLIRAGIQVPTPVALASGESVGRLDAPEGARPFTLNDWLVGAKPDQISDELYRDFGALTSRFHQAAADFVSDVHRRPIDAFESFSETTEQVAGCLADPDERNLVLSRSASARRRLADLAPQLTWGVRHGDVSLDNVLVRDGQLTLHDFDRSGPGWLAADLTGVQSTAHWAAFLSGYREVGTLRAADLEALPALRTMDLIFNLRFHLVDKTLVFGSESRAEGWVERELDSLRAVGPGVCAE